MRKKTGQVLTVDYILPDCRVFVFVCNIVCKNNHFMCCMWVWSCGCVILDCTVCVDLDRRLFCHHFILLLSKRKAHFIKAGYWFLDTFWVLTKKFPLRRWSKTVKSSKLESDLIHGQTLYLVHVFSKIRCLLVQVTFLWLLCCKTISYSLTSGITKSYCSLFRGGLRNLNCFTGTSLHYFVHALCQHPALDEVHTKPRFSSYFPHWGSTHTLCFALLLLLLIFFVPFTVADLSCNVCKLTTL